MGRRMVLESGSAPSAIEKMRKKGPLEGEGSVPEANVFALRAFGGQLLGFQRVFILLLSVAMMTALAGLTATSAEADQVPDNSYNPPIENPAYPQNSGPVVTIDEAHFNFHTMEGRYGPFATLLQRDGYVVRPSTAQFSAQSLQGVDILVIANPLSESNAVQEPNYSSPTPSAFTDAEIQAVRTWVENGGSLWLIADHFPWPGATDNLASAFGVHMLNGYAMRESSNDPNFYFRRSGGTEILSDNVISNGRTAAERVNNQVMNFTGSAFQVDQDRNALPLLTLGPGVVSIMATQSWTWDRKTPRIPVEGYYQGAALRVGQGRVAVFGEAAMFTAQLKDGTPMGMNAPGAEENYKFVLNVSHWLSGLLDPATGTIDTNITSGPSGPTNSTSATFGFSSTQEGSIFECSLDGAVFSQCASPKDYTGLANGSHTFRVRAIDAAGNADPSPAARTWTVDTTRPTITITTPTNGGTYSLNQVVNANYSCQDTSGGTGLKSCQGTVANGSAIDTASTGTKTFTVVATDNAGNQQSVNHTYSVAASVPSDCTIVGTIGNDTLNGTPQADVICGLEGNDTINSSGGNDIMRGGPGGDTLVDLSGTDNLLGGLGADHLNAQDGARLDRVDGGDGVDSCSADGRDKVSGCP